MSGEVPGGEQACGRDAGLALAAAVLVCPGVLEDLERRGAGDAVAALLEGLKLSEAARAGTGAFRWLRVAR